MKNNVPITGSCHCGAVSFVYPRPPDKLTSCNCSICRRIRGLWAYGTTDEITLTGADNTLAYVWGDKGLSFNTCTTCGCTTHWMSRLPEHPRRMAVNMAMADPAAIEGIRIRRFDGAETWEFLD